MTERRLQKQVTDLSTYWQRFYYTWFGWVEVVFYERYFNVLALCCSLSMLFFFIRMMLFIHSFIFF